MLFTFQIPLMANRNYSLLSALTLLVKYWQMASNL